MINVSGYGLSIMMLAIQSFPMGFQLEAFSDDVDPLQFEETEPFGFEMLYDGSMFAFDKAHFIKLKVSVIPGSDEDANLKILLQSKKGGASILPIPDSLTMVISYGGGGKIILTNGTILTGPFGDNVQSSGRKKGNQYTFVFASFAGAQTPLQLLATVAQNVISVL